MRIAFTQRHLDSRNGGEERSLFSILNHLSQENELTLFYRTWGDFNPKLNQKIHQKSYLANELSLKNSFVFILSILRATFYIQKNKVTRIHVNHYKDITWAAIVSILSGCKLSLHLRLNAPEYLSKQYAWGLKKCDFFIANSHFVADDWAKYITQPIHVIYNGIDFNPDEIQSTNEIVDLLFIGRIVPEKGLHLAIEALAQLESNRSLSVIGDFKHSNERGETEYKSQIENLVKKHNLENRVVFLGQITNPLPYIKKAAAVVVPSYFDSFGRTFMEAWTLKTPAITSRCGGIIELIAENPELENFTFEERNTADLAKTITELKNQGAKPKLFFEIEVMILQMQKLLRE